MTDPGKTQELTIKPTHFPLAVKLTAATCWGLAVVGAILEAVLLH
jgi:hypothetical protein